MRILGVMASPRGARGQTLRLMKAVLDGTASAGASVELVDVCQLRIEYCRACGTCYAKGACIHEDDFAALHARMLESDGIVLGSPDYFRSVAAQLKTVIDRMADTVHCQLFTGKYGCSVATAGGAAPGEVTEYLNRLLIGFGVSAVGSVAATPSILGAMEAAETSARELGKALVDAIATRRAFPEQAAIHQETRDRFKFLVSMNKDAWTHEYDHWRAMGWL